MLARSEGQVPVGVSAGGAAAAATWAKKLHRHVTAASLLPLIALGMHISLLLLILVGHFGEPLSLELGVHSTKLPNHTTTYKGSS